MAAGLGAGRLAAGDAPPAGLAGLLLLLLRAASLGAAGAAAAVLDRVLRAAGAGTGDAAV
ncbi:hypothetical protein ASF11_25570 [Acidovorax sp. Leaf76]|nr:hypothetical protein ASF11_25570 [Acidovorax sp. Leaf76]